LGDSAPYSLSQYYKPAWPANPANASVPTPGQPISLSDLHDRTSAPGTIPLSYTISSPTQNLNLLTYATSPSRPAPTRYTAGTPGYSIEFTISPGVVVGSAATGQDALVTSSDSPTGWHPDVTLSLINQGTISGAGGDGGNGGLFPSIPAGDGGDGGDGLVAQRSITIDNNSTIAGGGGGGGGGGGTFTPFAPLSGGVGGGGAGQSVGAPGPSGATLTTGGTGATAGGGNGGDGGNAGSAGQAGVTSTQPGGAGGAAGAYARGTSNITWQSTGTRQGPSQPTV
jgi:hypothetical protein